MNDIQKRAEIRKRSLRGAVKRPDSDRFIVIESGLSFSFTPAENIGRLEYLRGMAYPELLNGLRLDKSRVKISFRNPDRSVS